MKSVYKYTLEPHGGVELPTGAKILSVHAQHDSICLWALVDPNNLPVLRRFKVFGTGHPIANEQADRLSFVGTALLDGGYLVMHVFEEMPAPNPSDF